MYKTYNVYMRYRDKNVKIYQWMKEELRSGKENEKKEIHLKTDRILNLYDRLCQGQKILLKEEMKTGPARQNVR